MSAPYLLPTEPIQGTSPGQNTASEVFAPVRSLKRIEVLDGLRGLALFGIITANLWTFSGYGFLTEPQMQQLPTYALDRLVYASLHVLIDSKFSTIFSILFGVGFSIQIGRAGSKGIAFTGYFIKRMLILLGIASVHAYAFWYGDIIRFYAVAGLLMLLARNWSERRLLITAVGLMALATPVIFILNEVFAAPAADGLTKGQILTAFGQGAYPDVLRMNWRIDDVRNFWQGASLTLVSTTGKVMLGYWMGRIGLFTNPQAHQRLLRRWFWWGALVGLPSSAVFWAVKSGSLTLTPGLAWLPFVIAIGMVLHSLFYISAFVQAFQRLSWQRGLVTFVPVGKMALTNYLTQTLVGLLLFYGYLPGPHLMGQVGPANLLLLGITIYALQVVFSHWWLRTHEQGPVEWLWRKLSYRNS
ncbi:MAG: DUF418 domain-containing protein [Bacteroidetes bacterium]|nr:DUF418 domain-containing protein [Fibrella sp.]